MLLVAVLTMLILLGFLLLSQEICHCLRYIGVHISVAKFDVDDGVSLSVP